MQRLVKKMAIILLAVVVTACSSSEPSVDPSSKLSPDVLYNQARRSMELGNYSKAVRDLEALDSRYPFGPHKTQVQLDLIYAYYKLNDPASAIANIDRFIRLNPTHPNVDYVYYMRGLVNMQSDSYLFHDLFNIDRTDRDPKNAEQAFKDFERLIKSYPNSKYASDAQKRMIWIKDRLARYNIDVAKYYLKMNAWTAAAGRAQLVLETYPDTPSAEQALEIMIEAYSELGQKTLAKHATEVMQANFPSNALAKNQAM